MITNSLNSFSFSITRDTNSEKVLRWPDRIESSDPTIFYSPMWNDPNLEFEI